METAAGCVDRAGGDRALGVKTPSKEEGRSGSNGGGSKQSRDGVGVHSK